MIRLVSAWLFVVAVALPAARAKADAMDLTLSRLRVPTSGANLPAGCSAVGINGLPRDFCPDDDAWGRLVTELSAVTLSTTPRPARTGGYGGFQLTFGGSMTQIRSDQSYWKLGTRGDQPTLGAENASPSSSLLTVMGELRKGLPFGFELGATFGHVIDTSLWLVGGDLEWALVEGGIEWFPDIAVRGTFRTLLGGADFSLFTPGVELIISKPIAIGGSWVLTPLASWSLAWVIASTDVVDLTPDVNAVAECQPDPSVSGTSCTFSGTLPDGRVPGQDFNNQAKFADYRATRMRLTVGAEARFAAFLLSGTFAFDLVPADALSGGVPSGVARQWTAMLATGVHF
ncbi:MAG: hypothetical protein R3A78_06950 [Polyangiales bacterium]|nr:hypothetical protein [Myxococcales bacterium]